MRIEKTTCILLPIVIAALAFPIAGCKKKEVKKNADRKINVRVAAVEKKTLRPFIKSTGTLNPNETVIISSELDGIIRRVSVDEGQAVAKGRLVAAIEDTDFRLEVQRSQAALRQAEATYANLKSEYDRKEALMKEELVTRQQFDDVSARRLVAEAEIERAKAALALAGEKLARTKIHSPISGYVKEKKVATGDYVKNGVQMFVLIQNNPIKLNFSVSEREAGLLRKGQDVSFTVDAYPEREFKGKLSLVYPSLNEATRTLTAEALVPNPGGLLKPGLFSKVVLYTGAPRDMTVIPVNSLVYEMGKVKVFTVEGEVAREKEIKLGNKFGELMEVAEGLSPGETLVTAGQHNLLDGVKVHVAR